MKKILTTAVILLAAGIALSASVLAQQTASSPSAIELKTPKEKASYAIGMSIAASMKRDGVEVDTAILLRGMNDGLAGEKPLMTDEEARAAITALQKESKEKQEAKNKQEGDAFLAANKVKEGVITLPSGLQYKIEKQGDGPKPALSDTVECNYRGTLLNGKEFDSSFKRNKPASFPVAGVIPGWTEILQLMPVGSKYQIFVPADLAYKGRAAGADITPYSTLTFEIELLSIKEKPAAANAPAPAPAATKPSTTKPSEPAK
jgi:FKBP-type peptidyl-prolyl cis-trans isomerase